jgi:hypothetical protein
MQGEGGGVAVAGSQPMSTAVHMEPNKLWRSNSIFNLWFWLYRSPIQVSVKDWGILFVQMISTCLRGAKRNGGGDSTFGIIQRR